jgi:adenylyltransferase/sulfurtransferase
MDNMDKMDENDRYSRQTRFVKIGSEGQEKIRKGSVAIIGCGALGSAIAHNLARAGVGRLRIVDRGLLEVSNLARQVLFEEEDVRQRLPKAVAAANRLRRINSDVQVEPIRAEVSASNALGFIEGAHVVADGSDNMRLRFVLNDACVKTGVPWVYGGALGSRGMTMTILPGRGPCLRCVVEELPPPGAILTASETGVLNTLTATVAAVQSNEVLKLLLGVGPANTGLLRFDIWTLDFRRSEVQRRPDCPTCGLRKFEFLAEEEMKQ